MESWTPRLKLLSDLATTNVLLSQSPNEGWPDEKAKEAHEQIEAMIAHLFDRTNPLPEYWLIQFSPTGPVQEIAMANGWHDAYLKLAAEYDRLAYLLKEEDAS